MNDLPFSGLTNAQLKEEFELPRTRLKNLLEENEFVKYLKDAVPREQLEYVTECEYYDYEMFNKKFGDNFNLFSVLHVNLQSSYKNFNLLKMHLEGLKVKFDVLCISEAGLGNEDRVAHIFGTEYFYDYQAPVKNKGGVAIYINRNLSFIKRNDLNLKMSDSVENLWYEVGLKGQQVILGSLYRHPGYNTSVFCESLKESLCKADKENKVCITCGDINIDLGKPNQLQTKAYIDMLLACNAIPYIVLPTRITSYSATIIDHINIVLTSNMVKNDTYSGNLIMSIADHLPNFIIIKGANKTSVTHRPTRRCFSEKNIATFRAEVAQLNWTEVIDNCNPDDAYGIFIQKYKNAYDICFPLKRVSRKRIRDKKWITKGLKISIRHKNRLYKRFLTKPNERNLIKYKTYKNKLTKLIKKAESEYYSKLLSQKNEDTKHIWRIYSDIMNKNKNQTNVINNIIWKGKSIKDNLGIANAFNEYFTTIGNELANSLKDNISYKQYLSQQHPASMYLLPTDENEIICEITKLKSGKSPGLDGIHSNALKVTAEFIAKPLTHIFNCSFIEAQVPCPLKMSKTVPIHKKNEKHKPDNYRPISLLSIFSKLLEKLMHKRLYSFFEKHSLLNEHQFGFRKNHSTTLALIEIVDKIRQEIDNGNSAIGIYLDLTKAFDLMNHDILFYKLQYYGVRGKVLEWFKSYLYNREQYTYVNNTYSKPLNLNIGVPQGSILGPLLFLIYINDINAINIENTEIRLFADDTNLFIFHRNITVLEQKATYALSVVTQWFNDNKLCVNYSKTCFSVFSNRNTKCVQHLLLNGKMICRAPTAKYLGVMVDEKLSWINHIDFICKKISKLNYVFRFLAKYISKAQICQLYYAYIYPHISYAIEIYGTCCKTNMNLLQVKQNNVLRSLMNVNYRHSATDLYNELGLLKVSQIFELHVLTFVYKQRQHLLPTVFDTYYQNTPIVRETRNRGTNILFIEFARTLGGSKAIKIIGAKLWNKLPSHVKEAQSTFGFKKMVKAYIKHI